VGMVADGSVRASGGRGCEREGGGWSSTYEGGGRTREREQRVSAKRTLTRRGGMI